MLPQRIVPRGPRSDLRTGGSGKGGRLCFAAMSCHLPPAFCMQMSQTRLGSLKPVCVCVCVCAREGICGVYGYVTCVMVRMCVRVCGVCEGVRVCV